MDSGVFAIALRLTNGFVLAASLLLFPAFRLSAAPSDDVPIKPVAELHTGLTEGVRQQMFSPDGSLLVTSRRLSNLHFNSVSNRGMDLVVWDVKTGDVRAKVADGWSGFAFNNSGSVLAVWTDQEVSILDPGTGNRLATLEHQNVEHIQFLLQVDLVVTQTWGMEGFERVASELRFWNTTTWERVETKIDPFLPLISPAVSSDGKYVAGYEPAPRNVENGQSQLKLWEVDMGREVPIPKTLPDSLRLASNSAIIRQVVGFTRDGKSLCVPPVLWDIEAAEVKPIPNSFDEHDIVHPFLLADLHFQRKKKRAAIIEGKVFVWDSHEGEPIAEFINPVKEQPVDWVPDLSGSIMSRPWVVDNALGFTTKDTVTGSGTVEIWETASGKIIRSIVLDEPDLQLGGKHWIADSKSPLVRVAKDGKTIVVLEAGRNDLQKQRSCRITAYDYETGKRKYQLNGHNNFVSCLCLSSDSRLIATGSGADQKFDAESGEVKLWDLNTGELIRTVIQQGGSVLCLAFNSRGDQLAIGRNMSQAYPEVGLWEVSTGTKLLRLQLPPSNDVVRSPTGIPYEKHQNALNQPHSLAFSSDDRLLAVGGQAQLSLWNMPSGEFRSIGRIDGFPEQALRFSKDGEKLYRGSNQLHEIQVSKLRDRQAITEQVFRPTDAVSISGEFAMDTSDRLIAGCSMRNSGEISLWDTEKKELIAVFNREGVRSVDFTPNNQLVTGSIHPERFTTTFLDPETGDILFRFRHSGHPAMQFSPGGEAFATLKVVPISTKLIRHPEGYLQVKRTGSVAGVDLWDTRTGRKLAELPHEASSRVLFSPDGKILVSVGPVSVHLWKVSEFTRSAAD